MAIDSRSAHVTPVGGNIFSDLGFHRAEALALRKASKKRIAEKRAANAESKEGPKAKRSEKPHWARDRQ